MARLNFDDTIVALSTPKGTSALALIRLSGSEAIKIIASMVDRCDVLLTLLSGESAYLNFSTTEGEILDDVVVTVNRAPRSFTGEDLVEITFHGSLAIIDEILLHIVTAGARQAEPGEFSRRAFLNKKLDIEAIAELAGKIESGTMVGLRQSSAVVRRKFKVLTELYQLLLSLLARVNAEIDFGESDEMDLSVIAEEVASARSKLISLTSRASHKSANSAFVTAVLIGSPNVGKSSLFNALLQETRSLVSPIKGTTRDYIEAFIELGGYRIKLVDTAGLRVTTDNLEAEGIAMGSQRAADSEIVFHVTDPDSRQEELLGTFHLHNKVDLDNWNSGLSVSALSGQGLQELTTFLLSAAKRLSSELSELSFSSEDIAILRVAESYLGYDELDLALLAENLRSAISIFDNLLGINLNDDVLERIFSTLCIGK